MRQTEGEAMKHERPYTPETLADRWGVSDNTVRALCKQGALQHFRVGRMFRIPVSAVEEYEGCQKQQSEDCAEALQSHGMKEESGGAISLRHARERRPRQKP